VCVRVSVCLQVRYAEVRICSGKGMVFQETPAGFFGVCVCVCRIEGVMMGP